MRFSLVMALWLSPAWVSAQLAAGAETARTPLTSAKRHFGLEEFDGAEAAYRAANQLWPSAEAQLGLARVACARFNFGDCTVWPRAALKATSLALVTSLTTLRALLTGR